MIVQKTSKIAFMSLGVVINIVLAQVPMHLKLPFFLDVIGTIVISALAGPWIGALTGLVTNFVLGLQNPIWIPYALVQISIGLSVGFLAQKGAFKSYGGLALVAFVVWLVSLTYRYSNHHCYFRRNLRIRFKFHHIVFIGGRSTTLGSCFNHHINH
ncbi:MAG: hypothetical protein LRY24_00330 [Erysipelotrichaceae bacterium]|nr:hypothetical protein [Erysipelotrichaceae bacterium]